AGIAGAMIFGCIGAAYGTAKSGIGIAGVGTFRPDLIMKALPHPRRHVRYHRRLRARHLRPNRPGPGPFQLGRTLQLIRVRSLTSLSSHDISGDILGLALTKLPPSSGFMHLGAGLSVGLTGL
ncbi:hypothetical protein BN1708_018974, partial [Verticillium longisporum]